jgi:hypothetical protein
MFGYVEQKLLGRSRKSLVFLKSNFFGSEKFQVSAHIFRNKKFCSVKITFSCTFAVIQILGNIGSLPFISWTISMKLSDYYVFMPIYTCAKLRLKISKNKICHFWQAQLAATGPLWNIFFITEWIALKFKILSDLKIRFKKNQTFSQSAQ